LIFGRSRLPSTRIIALLLMVLGSMIPVAIFLAAVKYGHIPEASGSTTIGLSTGILAGAIFLFEAILGLRKQWRRKRLGKLRLWMSLHVWLGLLTLPLVWIHCVGKLGGTLTTVLTIVFLMVYLSGIWGLILQQVIPGTLLNTFRGETIASEIDLVMKQWVYEIENDLSKLNLIAKNSNQSIFSQKFEFGTGAGSKSTQITLLDHAELSMDRPEFVGLIDRLNLAFESQIRPYLMIGAQSRSRMRSMNHAERIFNNLSGDLIEESSIRKIVKRMEEATSLRREKDNQRRYHFWLHNWLWIHLPFTLILMILLVVHILAAMKLW
jgi:hypothetical protein